MSDTGAAIGDDLIQTQVVLESTQNPLNVTLRRKTTI